jgi:hypothetical protein
MKVPWRVQMSAVMGRKLNLLHGPALTIRQILGLQPREEVQHRREALLVVNVVDPRMIAGRICRHVVVQRHRNVDQPARHDMFSSVVAAGFDATMSC